MKYKLILFFCIFLNEAMAQKKPNVIILYSDQHNAHAIGFMGHSDVKTPNLDKLVKNGIAFTRAYCPDAICAPSRNSLMSGLYPRTLGILNNGESTYPSDKPHISDLKV